MATFIMIAAYKMEARLLRIASWLPIAIIGFGVVFQLIHALCITGVIGGYNFDNVVFRVAEIIIMTSITLVVQGLLAWTIRRAVKEAEETGITVQASYIPCKIDV